MDILGGCTSVIIWLFFAFFIGWFAANEKHSQQKLAQLNAKLISVRQELAEKSRAEENFRISHKLHDDIGCQLVALSLHLDIANRLSESSCEASISTAQSLVKQMLGEVRREVSRGGKRAQSLGQ